MADAYASALASTLRSAGVGRYAVAVRRHAAERSSYVSARVTSRLRQSLTDMTDKLIEHLVAKARPAIAQAAHQSYDAAAR